ncbi:hypothetical protein Tco_0291127 [Tanacetum coccineum]
MLNLRRTSNLEAQDFKDKDFANSDLKLSRVMQIVRELLGQDINDRKYGLADRQSIKEQVYNNNEEQRPKNTRA